MLKKQVSLILTALLLVVASSCSKYQRLLKSTDYDKKYEMAIKYYENKEYQKAYPLLEELMTIFRGTSKGEKVYFYYAYTNYHLQDYILASYHFKNFAKTYPTSANAEEAMFLSAKCFYINSPGPSLDQTNTKTAINEFQLFVNLFPNSPKVQESNEIIDQLRLKLETKDFNNAKLYFDVENYKAAIVALGNVLKDFPETKYKEEVFFLMVKSHFLLASNSVESKKQERYQAVLDTYLKFVDTFPNSKQLKPAEKYYEDSLRLIEKYNKQTNNL